MGYWIIGLSGLFGATAVVCGALGSHVLRASLPAASYVAFSIGVDYLLLHAVVLLACGLQLTKSNEKRSLAVAAVLFVVGIVLFSGGLIVGTSFDQPSLRTLAPYGGGALILAWLALASFGFGKFWKHR